MKTNQTKTLLIRCCAPMQSWGSEAIADTRDAGREPSKSGVVGVLASALGRKRDADLGDLSALKMGVRILREGLTLYDFQTAEGTILASGKAVKEMVISRRYYLSDADFLVALEGDGSLLATVAHALRHPAHSLFLGRRAFVPSLPMFVPNGLGDARLEESLHEFVDPFGRPKTVGSADRYVIEDLRGDEVRWDVPLSFSRRRFASRRVRTQYVSR